MSYKTVKKFTTKYNLEKFKFTEDGDYYNNSEDKNFTCLMYAIYCGCTLAVDEIICANSSLLNDCNLNGHTPFYFACQEYRYEISIMLYEKGADINRVFWETTVPKISTLADLQERGNGYYENICQFACRKGCVYFVKLLLENDIITVEDIYLKNENGVSPLMWAEANKHRGLVNAVNHLRKN